MSPIVALIARHLGRIVFWAWVPTAAIVGALLMAGHSAALPTPSPDDDRLLAALAELRTADDEDRWQVVHVLYAACTCSGGVVDHLVDDPRPNEVTETILWIGSAPEVDARLAAVPMPVVRVTPSELVEHWGIEGAPLLLVVDPDGLLRYRGGYTDRKQSLAFRDVEIIEGLQGDGRVPVLPLLGCAVSQRLRELVDPLGLRASEDETDDSP